MKTRKLLAIVICIMLCFSLASCMDGIDKSALNTAIAEAEALKEGDYTAASWQNLSQELTEAKIVNAKQYATQTEINSALAALTAAVKDLVTKSTDGTVSKTALNTKIADCELLVEANYTATSWAALSLKLADAKTIRDKADATQTEVNTALSGLNLAVLSLVPVAGTGDADKTALNITILLYESMLQQWQYTSASWAAYSIKLAAAKAVSLKANATQTEVDAALLNLNNAAYGLVEEEIIDG